MHGSRRLGDRRFLLALRSARQSSARHPRALTVLALAGLVPFATPAFAQSASNHVLTINGSGEISALSQVSGQTGTNGTTGENGGAGEAANGNTVHVTGALGDNEVFGGSGGNGGQGGAGANGGAGGSANHNTLTLTNVSSSNQALGGDAGVGGIGGEGGQDGAEGTASDNSVALTKSFVEAVLGGAGAQANGNIVTLENSAAHAVAGGAGAQADGNSVALTSSAAGLVIGGGDGLQANDNSVTLTDSFAGVIVGGVGGEANGNTVTLGGKNGSDAGIAVGAISLGGTAENNRLIINNVPATTNESAPPGSLILAGAMSSRGVLSDPDYGPSRVTGNAVTINGGTVAAGLIAGGVGSPGDTVADNRVTITGGKVVALSANGQSLGPYIVGSMFLSYPGGPTGPESSDNNTVVLEGTPDLAGAQIYGAARATLPNGTSTLFNVTPLPGSRNTLEVWSKGLTASQVGGFQQYEFLLPTDTKAGDTVLTLAGGQPTNLKGAGVGVAVQSGKSPLRLGDRVTLLRNASGIETDPTVQRTTITGIEGISLEYRFNLSADPNDLYAIVSRAPRVLAQTKAPVEASLAGTALVTQGTELAGGAGMEAALEAAHTGQDLFAVTSGGHASYDTGSHIDANGFSGIFGIAHASPVGHGTLTLGVFGEGGYGSFSTHNAVGTDAITGDGNAHYAGGGLLARVNWFSAVHGGPYVGGLFHAGATNISWGSAGLAGASFVSYDRSAPYYAGQVQAGWVQPLNAITHVNLSARLSVDHLGGSGATLNADPYEFNDVNSVRSRLNAKLSRAISQRFAAWAEIGWIHEYAGTATATVYDLGTPSPSLRGDTAVFGVGFGMRPGIAGPLTVTFGVNGFAGEETGVAGTARLQYRF